MSNATFCEILSCQIAMPIMTSLVFAKALHEPVLISIKKGIGNY